MKFCQQHWDKLRDAINARGLGQFVASSGDEATRRMAAELDSKGVKRTTFEPLMGAFWAISSNAISAAGLEIMAPNEDGTDRCPLCFLLASCSCGLDPCPFATWIDRAADDQRAHAVQLGLLGAS